MFVSVDRGAVEDVRATLGALVAALDPAAVSLGAAPGLWDAFDAVERLAAAGKVLLAERVEESQCWRRQGYPSAAEYMAAKAGTSAGAARSTLDTSKKLRQAPKTNKALRQGTLSKEKAAAVADAAAANPAAEERLLRKAGSSSLHDTREACGRAKAAADSDPEATRKRIHSQRRLRRYVDGEGAWNLSARGTIEDGALIEAALQPLLEEIFKAARERGDRDEHDAYAFDALTAMAERAACGGGQPARRSRGRKSRALIRVDLDALVRGSVGDGELCEITGIGPVSVSRARQLLGESVLYLVCTRGVDVANITYLGRGANAAQQIALLWSMPRCTVEGCNRTLVENDHREPYVKTRHTRLDELDPKCSHHHALTTYQGWALVPGTGRRALVPPDDPRHPANNPTDPAQAPRPPNLFREV